MPTLADLQVEGDAPTRADLVMMPDEKPDVTVHDPVTFSGMTGQRVLEMRHAQGLMPTPDEIKKVEDDSLAKAQEYWSHTAEQAERERVGLLARKAAVTPGVTAEGKIIPSIAAQEEQTRAGVDIAKQQTLEQWKQGRSAAAVAASQPGGTPAGEIKALTDEEQKDFVGYNGAFNTIKNLHTLFDNMVTNTPGAGHNWSTLAGLTNPIMNIVSPEARLYNSYAEGSLVPLAKGVMGDAATAAAKDKIQENMLQGLPTINDSPVVAGGKIYNLLDRNLRTMQDRRDFLRANGSDTTGIDSKILDAQQYMKDPAVQRYNPYTHGGELVSPGTTEQANATINNLNAGANAGVQSAVPSQLPAGQAGAYTTPPTYTPQQTPSVMAQHEQAYQAAQNVQQVGEKIPGQVLRTGQAIGRGVVQSVVTPTLQAPGEESKAAGTAWNWLQGILNTPQSVYNQPRPWETTSNQFVGTGP